MTSGCARRAFREDVCASWSESEVLEVMAAAARVVRAGEALLVEATGHAAHRSDGRLSADRMTTRFGLPFDQRLVQRVTRPRSSARVTGQGARAVVQPVASDLGGFSRRHCPHARRAR